MDYSKLIPELSLWNGGRGIDVGSWINGRGSFEHAIAYSHLFWPELVEHDDCIFRLDVYNLERYQAWLKSTQGNKTATEQVMNHIHLGDLFPNSSTRTMPQKNYLARLLKETWECKLQREFPGVATVVELSDCAADDEDWTDCQLTFFRKR
jgi:hypothetical protein